MEIVGVLSLLPRTLSLWLRLPHPLIMASPSRIIRSNRFKFDSRLNKPILSVSITVILVEEEDRPSVSVHTSTSQSEDDSVLQGEDVAIVFDCGELRAEGSVFDVLKPPEDNTQDILASADPANPLDGN